MRYLFLIVSALFSVLFLASCEKVIELDLKDAEKKYVIEGILTDQPDMTKVLISQSKKFDEGNDFPGVSDASVSITDNATGESTELVETSPGVYEAASMKGIPGQAYTLRVSIGETSFTATSTMPLFVNMDTIYVTEENMFGEIWKLANIELQDPEGIENRYRYVQYINGVKSKGVFIRDDGLSDGLPFSTKLYMTPDTEEEDRLKSGDEVKIEMQCIDPKVYKYWYSLDQSATGSSQSATPANPVSNIEGGALGYFSAHTTQTKTMIVP